MSPTAEPAAAAHRAAEVAAERILRDGETILLAIKPSPWFVLLVSWPVLLIAGGAAAAVALAAEGFGVALPVRTIGWFCAAAAAGRVVMACFQWAGRLYVLTDLRVIWMRGVARVEVLDHPLRRIELAEVAASPGQRLLGVGTLCFEPPAAPRSAAAADADNSLAAVAGPCEHAWVDIARPAQVAKAVNDAIRRMR